MSAKHRAVNGTPAVWRAIRCYLPVIRQDAVVIPVAVSALLATAAGIALLAGSHDGSERASVVSAFGNQAGSLPSATPGAPAASPGGTPGGTNGASPGGSAPGSCTSPVTGQGTRRGGTTDTSDTTAYPASVIIPAPCTIPVGGVPIGAGQDIQSAVSSNPAGTAFVLAAGTWLGNETVIVPKQGDKFYGQGAGKTILRKIAIHSWSGSSSGSGVIDVEIHNMTFDGYATGGSGGTAFGAVDDDDHGGRGGSTGWLVTNSEFENGYIGVSAGVRTQVIDNTFHDNTCKGGADGIDGTVWEYNQFIDNDLPGVNDPIVDCGGLKAESANGKFLNNLFSGNGTVGVKGGAGYPGDALWFDFGSAAGGNNNDIENNIFYGNSGPGIEFEGITQDNTVRGNIIVGNARTAYPGAIFLQGASKESVLGNFIWGNVTANATVTIVFRERGSASGSPAMIPSGSTVSGNFMDADPSDADPSGKLSGNTVTSNTVAPVSTWASRVPALAAGPQ